MIDVPLKALSVRQPWAWAIIHGGKDIENRSTFAVSKGGFDPRRIAIHASKGMTRDEYESAASFMATQSVSCPRPDDLVRGAIIGVVTVDAVVKDSDSPWFFGPRGLVLSGAEAVEPIPAIGALGYFEWTRHGEPAEALPWMKKWNVDDVGGADRIDSIWQSKKPSKRLTAADHAYLDWQSNR